MEMYTSQEYNKFSSFLKVLRLLHHLVTYKIFVYIPQAIHQFAPPGRRKVILGFRVLALDKSGKDHATKKHFHIPLTNMQP